MNNRALNGELESRKRIIKKEKIPREEPIDDVIQTKITYIPNKDKKQQFDKKEVENGVQEKKDIANVKPVRHQNVPEINRKAITLTNWLMILLFCAIMFLAVSKVMK